MKLADKIKMGLCAVMLAGEVTVAASLYSMINPLVQMAKNPTEATVEAKKQYVSQYPIKEKIFYMSLGAIGISLFGLVPLSLYSKFEENKSLKGIEESVRRLS